MRNYLLNVPLTAERLSEELRTRAERIAAKWSPCSESVLEELSASPNLINQGLALIRNETGFEIVSWCSYFHPGLKLYHIISSSLLLYRLLCLFRCTVHSEGPCGYKAVFDVTLLHKETGKKIAFTEWKGAAEVFLDTIPDAEEPYARDMLELLNLLCSMECPHPYDGVVAGAVA